MARTCTICRHEKRADIDKALIARVPFRNIAGRHKVSKSALVRHLDDHIPAALLKAKDAEEVAQADVLLRQVGELRDRALAILDVAEAAAEYRDALAAIREARGCLELLGKLAGQLKDAPTVNVILSAEWRDIQAVMLAALEPYMDARLAVAEALTTMESHHAAGHA